MRRYAPYLYVLLRIVAGLLFACHGAQKLFGVFGGIGGQPGANVPLVSLLGFAGCIELVDGLLIALGVLTSWAAFVASGQMAFAYFMQHFPRGFWPMQNDGELAVLYCFLFLYIAANGAGMWGVWRRRPFPSTTPAAHEASTIRDQEVELQGKREQVMGSDISAALLRDAGHLRET